MRRLGSSVARHRVLVAVITCAAFCVGVSGSAAQGIETQPSNSSFTAISVKKNDSGDQGNLGFQGPSRFRAIGETVARMVGEGYGENVPLPLFKIVGGPAWISSERYDVNAVAEGTPTATQQHALLRRLLSDRFGLRAHVEQRELPVYVLTVDRPDGKLGPQLKPSDVQCAQQRPSSSATPNQPPPCMMRFGRGLLGATGMTIAQLAGMGLSRFVGRDVLDKTGLNGGFDWTLTFTPAQRGAPLPDPASPAAGDDVSIYTAVREQLGLKLVPERAPVDVLVIDQVERPKPD